MRKAPTRETPSLDRAPLRSAFSAQLAAQYLDAKVHAHEKNCLACHGTFGYLSARPALRSTTPVLGEARQALETFVDGLLREPADRQKTPPLRISQTVMAAATMADLNAAEGKLQPLTRRVLDRMWNLQGEDGGWNWVKKNQPPSESDDHFGVTTAALAAGMAPEGYADSPPARVGLENVRRYLRGHPPGNLHQRGMLLLAARRVPGLMTDPQRRSALADLLAGQHADGGWSLAALGDWRRADQLALDPAVSDGYGTGFVLYVLRTGADLPVADPHVQHALGWLRTHQRAAGYWFTRSPHVNDALSTYVGTAMALRALDACQALPRPEKLSQERP